MLPWSRRCWARGHGLDVDTWLSVGVLANPGVLSVAQLGWPVGLVRAARPTTTAGQSTSTRSSSRGTTATHPISPRMRSASDSAAPGSPCTT